MQITTQSLLVEEADYDLVSAPFFGLSSAATIAASPLGTYPPGKEHLPAIEITEGRYTLRFAQNQAELDAVLKLRFEIFNLELGEGLAASYRTGRDHDQFDFACHHLIVVENATGNIIGTYRVQTNEMAAAGCGFYSAGEYDLSGLPVSVLNQSVELGRACIVRSHRNTKVLFLLWKGLAVYLAHNRKRFFFGCCSLTSQDPAEGLVVKEYLHRQGYRHQDYVVSPLPDLQCLSESHFDQPVSDVDLPPLFKIYLRYGVKVCGEPAIDREFKTIDFLVLLDALDLDEKSQRMFFGM
jgi:putative hemolysin